jgi:hypothetical protein
MHHCVQVGCVELFREKLMKNIKNCLLERPQKIILEILKSAKSKNWSLLLF